MPYAWTHGNLLERILIAVSAFGTVAPLVVLAAIEFHLV